MGNDLAVMTLAYWLVHSQLHAQESLPYLELPRALRFSLGNICSFAPARWTLIGYGCFSLSLLSNSTCLSWVEQFSFAPLIYKTGPASLAFQTLLWCSVPKGHYF